MESRNGLITFGIFVLLSVFTFVFCLDALAIPNTTYGVLAIIGYVVIIAASFFNGFTARKNGEALGVWFTSWAVSFRSFSFGTLPAAEPPLSGGES